MKKLFNIIILSVLSVVILLALASRFSGSGIRISDGQYLGYSSKTSQWLFFDYQNYPVSHDGPYVFIESDEYLSITVDSPDKVNNLVTKSIVTDQVLVKVDNPSNTQFQVPLRENYARSKLTYTTDENVLVMSDIEGNFDAAVELLTANGVIDSALNWRFGKGHLVLIGDMVDRGRNVVPTLWLLYKLEAQANQAGGQLHYILGNHERYLLDGRTKSVAKKYYGTYSATGLKQAQLWSETSVLGRWLRTKPVLLKINDILYVHGGISPEVLSVKPSIASIDELAKESFVTSGTVVKNIDEHLLHSSKGLLFYRGLAKDMSEYDLGKKASQEHVEQVLDLYQVNHIAIGHTLTEHIGFDFNNKVIRVDVDHSNGESEALLLENNSFFRVDGQGNRHSLRQIEEPNPL